MTTAPANGFALKALIVFAGVFLTALLGFFAWLAVTVGEIKENVAGIKSTVDGLVATRSREATPPTDSNTERNTERNTRRIEQLEGGRR